MKAIAIRMKDNYVTETLQEIDSICVEQQGGSYYYKKEDLYDRIQYFGWDVQVDIYPYPKLRCAESIYGEKFVRSTPDGTPIDNLLMLPKY